MTDHIHTFSVPVDGEPHARQCADCGERQDYSVPTGKGYQFTDVLIDAVDLQQLLGWVEGPDYDPHGDFGRLMERIYAAIGD